MVGTKTSKRAHEPASLFKESSPVEHPRSPGVLGIGNGKGFPPMDVRFECRDCIENCRPLTYNTAKESIDIVEQCSKDLNIKHVRFSRVSCFLCICNM